MSGCLDHVVNQRNWPAWRLRNDDQRCYRRRHRLSRSGRRVRHAGARRPQSDMHGSAVGDRLWHTHRRPHTAVRTKRNPLLKLSALRLLPGGCESFAVCASLAVRSGDLRLDGLFVGWLRRGTRGLLRTHRRLETAARRARVRGGAGPLKAAEDGAEGHPPLFPAETGSGGTAWRRQRLSLRGR